VDAVGAVGGAGGDLVEEDHLALPLLHAERVAGEAGEAGGQRGELVVVGGEEGAAAVRLVEVLDDGPGDREAVVGGGAAADLVEDDEAAGCREVQDRGGLDHLDHEGRAAAGEVVGGADAGEQAVDDADAGAGGGDEAAGLGEEGDERVLAEEGALAGHVRAGEEPQGRGGAEVAVVADEGLVVAGERLLDDGVAAGLDVECGAVVDDGADVAALGGQSANAAVTSASARAPATSARWAPWASTAWRRSSKRASSSSRARSPAVAMRASRSASSAVA
jgi:hypothetical protein